MPAAKTHQQTREADQATIVIRQVVATIEIGRGNTTPLQAAYAAAAQYIEDHATGDKDIHLEWDWYGGTFSANYTAPDSGIVDLDRMD